MLLFAAACESPQQPPQESSLPSTPAVGSFGEAVAFLQQHTDVLVLSDAEGAAQVAVVPAMQGRVLTSTPAGPDGPSLGWINRVLIASGDTLAHINPYGGEDRFWFGPEGGQYSIFFKPGDPFDLEHWFTPAPIDTEPFDLVASDAHYARFTRSMRLHNYAGFTFDVAVEREVRLLDRAATEQALGLDLDTSIRLVAFASDNTIRNAGAEAWKPETGLLSIWILGMFNASPQTTVVIPFHEGPEETLGPVVNDAYFGTVPADRLTVQDGVLFFKGDSRYRSKIGLTPARAQSLLGSYDATNAVLTLVQYNKPDGVLPYVNSMWEIQNEPYAGDVVNSYNDGPPTPGAAQLGPFYELESSSPAAALAPGESLRHIHRTFHFQGSDAALDALARQTLGVSLDAIKSAL